MLEYSSPVFLCLSVPSHKIGFKTEKPQQEKILVLGNLFPFFNLKTEYFLEFFTSSLLRQNLGDVRENLGVVGENIGENLGDFIICHNSI